MNIQTTELVVKIQAADILFKILLAGVVKVPCHRYQSHYGSLSPTADLPVTWKHSESLVQYESCLSRPHHCINMSQQTSSLYETCLSKPYYYRKHISARLITVGNMSISNPLFRLQLHSSQFQGATHGKRGGGEFWKLLLYHQPNTYYLSQSVCRFFFL